MASTYLKRDLSVSETIYKWTWSAWVKRGTVNGSAQNLFKSRQDSSNWVQCYFGDGSSVDKIILASYKNGGYHYDFTTNRLFRDTNAWYHIMINVDSSQSTAGDRVRIYVNGERETSFSNSTNNLSNGDSLIFNSSDSGTGHTIGSWNAGSYFNGSMSHVHYSSGYSYAPTVFGSTDSTTGEWKINTSPSFTLGGNGYTVLKDGNTITDQSSNSNDFTLGGGTLTKTEDNPSNVFATLNPLSLMIGGTYTFTNGNTTSEQNISRGTVSNLGMTSGKFYAEAKFISTSGTNCVIGICGINNTSNQNPGLVASGYIYDQDGTKGNNDSNSSFGNTYTTGDIIGIAVDLDNNKIYFSKNGTWQNSGDPTSGSTGTGAAYTISAASSTPDGAYFFAWSDIHSTAKASWNFGNGYFGTTAVSSAGTNASGNGIFEYDVPTGYTALSTKGLNL